jgi:signal transduction histidine kinase
VNAAAAASASATAQRSLRSQLGRLLAIGVAVLVLVVALVGISEATVLQSRHRALYELGPGAVVVRDYVGSLVNQESSVRGYALARQDDFLEPYRDGIEEQEAAVAMLRREFADDGQIMEALEAAERAAALWHEQVAEPIVSSTGPPPGRAALDAGKASFDAFRTASDELVAEVGDARADALSLVDRNTRLLLGSLVVALIAVVAAGWVIYRALQRSVLEPLGALVEDAEAVAVGDLERPVVPQGPADIAAAGVAVEAMRIALLEELAEVAEARDQLERQAVDLQRSNEELEQFAYVASHDLQEPLRKVTSFCQLLEQRYGDEIDDRGKEYIAYAVDGAKRMQILINDLLAFSRVGRRTEGFIDVDLNGVVAEALENLGSRVTDSGATVTADRLPTVPGDRALLVSLFQNLVGNAVKFRSDDPPVIEITAARSGDTWDLTVSDNGIGIEGQFSERVFVIFQRLHSREAYEGTGIGLSLCRKIVEFHGGRIWIDPDVEHGTTVHLTLPAHVHVHVQEPTSV